MIFLSVTHTALTPARSGIQTVSRSVVRAMPDAVPVSWFDSKRYFHTLPPSWAKNVGAPNPERTMRISSLADVPVFIAAFGRNHHVPIQRHPRFRGTMAGSWLLMTELMNKGTMEGMIAFARRHGMRVAAIFFDVIPLQRPDLTQRTVEQHTGYIEALNHCDIIFPISQASANGFREFGGHAPMHVAVLPAEPVTEPRAMEISPERAPLNILCVSTLEPRKNHRTLLAAFEAVGGDAVLHLAGAEYGGAPEIAESVRAACLRNPRIRWHPDLTAPQLAELYRACDFTIYPSILEGFGLPVMESLWFARPCICADFGVMAENAAGGGCLTVDVRETAALAGAIRTLMEQPELRRRLASEATQRPLRTWQEYVDDLRDAMV